MAVENIDVNMVVDDNMGVAPMVDDEDEGQEDFQGYYGESDDDDRTSRCTTLELPGIDGAGADNAPKTFWEYTILPVKDPESVINNVDLGGKANMYDKTIEGNSKKLEKKEDAWLNITGIGDSSHEYTFVRAIYLQGPGQEYLHHKCSSGRFRDVCFRMIPGVKPVMWEHCVSEDGRTVAVQFFYALSGNRMFEGDLPFQGLQHDAEEAAG